MPSLILSIFDTDYIIGECTIIFMTFHPILNSLFNIVFISTYRNYCLEFLAKFCKKAINNNVMPMSSIVT